MRPVSSSMFAPAQSTERSMQECFNGPRFNFSMANRLVMGPCDWTRRREKTRASAANRDDEQRPELYCSYSECTAPNVPYARLLGMLCEARDTEASLVQRDRAPRPSRPR